jgi:hypothetical protein
VSRSEARRLRVQYDRHTGKTNTVLPKDDASGESVTADQLAYALLMTTGMLEGFAVGHDDDVETVCQGNRAMIERYTRQRDVTNRPHLSTTVDDSIKGKV